MQILHADSIFDRLDELKVAKFDVYILVLKMLKLTDEGEEIVMQENSIDNYYIYPIRDAVGSKDLWLQGI